MNALQQLKALRRGKVHGGYRWMAVLSDGECVCEKCVAENYSLLFRNTYRYQSEEGLSFVKPLTGWECIGVTNSGEAEEDVFCIQCGRKYFEAA